MSHPPDRAPSAPLIELDEDEPLPAAPPARCLSDPNFFRLRYQLAAQSLNYALEQRKDTPPSEASGAEEPPAAHPRAEAAGAPAPGEAEDAVAKLERESRELAEEAARVADELADSKAQDDIKAAKRHAEELTMIVRTTIQTLHGITKEKTRWGRFRTLTDQQKRLQRFLGETVQPCGELVVAGARAALGDLDRDKRAASAIRDSVQKGDLSYRVAYNLACFELAHLDEDTAEESWALALDALRIALRDAPNQRQRSALVAWARRDPALKPISEFPDFEKLLQRNEIERTNQEQASTQGSASGSAAEQQNEAQTARA